MGRNRSGRALALAVFSWVASAVPAIADQLDLPTPPKASLLSLTAIPWGSDDPPGDRVAAALLIYPGVGRVDLALEAELVEPTGVPARALATPSPRPVRARGPSHRAPDGRFRLEVAATARGGGEATEVAMVVPHAELDLAPGRGFLRYRLRGKVAGVDAFEATSALLPIPGDRRPPTLAAVPAPPIPPAEVLDPEIGRANGLGATPNSPSTARPPVGAAVAPMPPAPSKGLPDAAPPMPGKTMPAAQAPMVGMEAPTPQAFPSFTILPKRAVLFATNRAKRSSQGTPSVRFGNEVGGMSYGTCLVNVPTNHVQGTLELPAWYSGSNPANYFLIDATNLLADQSAFRDLVRGAETRGDVLVYVHGFNTAFDFAVLRLAQVVHDIQFAGVPVLFSWPSHGSAFAYDADESNALRSVDALADTLLTLVAAQEARPEGRRGKVHVLAHSLGNRVTLRAFEKLDRDPRLAAGRKPFGQVILAAPDVSVAEFASRLHSARDRADRVSLYFCPEDEALLASQVRHPGEPRAGRGVVPLPGLDNVDARKANTSFLGHGYWAEVKQFLIDLQMLVNLGLGPDRRNLTLDPITLVKPPDYRYWSFR